MKYSTTAQQVEAHTNTQLYHAKVFLSKAVLNMNINYMILSVGVGRS